MYDFILRSRVSSLVEEVSFQGTLPGMSFRTSFEGPFERVFHTSLYTSLSTTGFPVDYFFLNVLVLKIKQHYNPFIYFYLIIKKRSL